MTYFLYSVNTSRRFLRVRAWGWWSRSPVAWGLSSLFHAQETGDLRWNRTGRSPHGLCCRLIGRNPPPPLLTRIFPTSWIADQHHFNADPDLAFHFNANPDTDPAPHQSEGILRLLNWSIDPSGHRFERPQPYTAMFWASKASEYFTNADPDPAFHSNADPDPDPAAKNTVDPCCAGSGSWSATLLTSL